ncbi:hypothetical protein SESBI_32186 [Sesbania bispinosa]|nr:hypothetical protein SESBI_32186 [Sesbania bispinosa]
MDTPIRECLHLFGALVAPKECLVVVYFHPTLMAQFIDGARFGRVSIWQMVVAPPKTDITYAETNGGHIGNGYVGKFHSSDDHEDSESDEDFDSADPMKHSATEYPRVAIGFDDECLRIYDISDADEFIYVKSLPRVKSEIFFL